MEEKISEKQEALWILNIQLNNLEDLHNFTMTISSVRKSNLAWEESLGPANQVGELRTLMMFGRKEHIFSFNKTFQEPSGESIWIFLATQNTNGLSKVVKISSAQKTSLALLRS